MKIQALERNPGKEESIFEDLVQFASQQGILMPFGQPDKRGDGEKLAEVPLNTIVIEDEQATDVLWEAIRSKIRKGIWTLLANLPLSDQQSDRPCDEQTKIKLLHDLCFLYPADEIWKGYKNYRRKLMNQYISNKTLLQGIETDFVVSSEVPSNVAAFVKLCRAVEVMIYEDAMILQEGIFPTMVPSFDFIHELYLGRITQELQSVFHTFDVSKKDGQGFLNETAQASGSRRGSNVSYVKQTDSKDNLIAHKHCFEAMINLETLVYRVTSQRSENEGTGTYNVCDIHVGSTMYPALSICFEVGDVL